MKRNKFSLSHYKLATMNMGELIPLTCYEALPGDTVQQSTSVLLRVSPLNSPVMHPVRVRIHHWFVPNRLIWDTFEDFITGGPDGTDATLHPFISTAGPSEGDLLEYLGVPPGTYGATLPVSALPLRAYQMIWNEYYRDQDLQTEAVIDTTAGADTTTETSIQNVCWEKDYFTAARPWETKGDAVTIPLQGSAPIEGIGLLTSGIQASASQTYRETGKSPSTTTDSAWVHRDSPASGGEASFAIQEDSGTAGWPNVVADLAEGTGAMDINDLRLALAVQRYQEARAQYGSRYVEYLRYLGVRPSDGRLQNPEYLGGGRQTIQFSEVLATADAGTADPGDMFGHGISAMRTNKYRRFIEEHGIIMTLMSVLPKTIYTQGIHKGHIREVKEDYFQKELQTIGEQEVYNKEVYPEHTSPNAVFGYQSRYDEYRSHPSSISGEFHSTLNYWHYGRIFASDPSLNSSFVSAVPTKRVNQDVGSDCLYVMANHSIQARRQLLARAKGRVI